MLGGCDGRGSNASPQLSAQAGDADVELRALARGAGLTGDPATPRGARRILPAEDPLVKLGQLLFFSQTLAGAYDVSCGTCHHPDFGGSDGLSLPVGVAPKVAATVGPGRQIDPDRDRDPSADGGPNMHRNSLTSFNAALFDRALMHDGRVFVLDAPTASGGRGQRIRTPESGQAHDVNPLDGLMEFTMKGPIVNDNEMRGFLYSNYPTPVDYREHLARRLRGEVDTRYNARADAPANWLVRFRAAFGQPTADAPELITVLNMQRALAAYTNSQVFIDTPWRQYLNGYTSALSEDAKAGARLFLTSKQDGGLGCSACHAGDRFTDEAFHNVGLPHFGRGFGRSDRGDMGRWGATRAERDLYAFRTVSLLNVGVTAPYGRTGAFETLPELLAYHANPREAVQGYDFSLRQLRQFQDGGVSYPHAQRHTLRALGAGSFARAEPLLPGRGLTAVEIQQLVAFLGSLTDSCVATPACIGQWAPAIEDDPDGHLLLRDRPGATPGAVEAQSAADYPELIPVNFPTLPVRWSFADVEGCQEQIRTAVNTGKDAFVPRAGADLGLDDRHGYAHETWFRQQNTLEVAMNGGGVTAAYLDEDCWPDLIFTGGSDSGMRFYANRGGKRFEPLQLLPGLAEREFSGAAVADLDGDYRRELLLGNIKPGAVPIFGADGSGRYRKLAELPMSRPTYGISFAPLDESGNLYFYLAHWSNGNGTNGVSPALWRYSGAGVAPWDKQARTTSADVDQRSNFTPKFADFTGDGRIDLVVSSDFLTSATLRNLADGQGKWHFENETARAVITDENGMGSALLDMDNDGVLEWFVTSVLDPVVARDPEAPRGNWGVTGNRLYRSTSAPGRIAFADITSEAGVRDGYWGWGACAADFNNDGFIDLFHVNGFGRIPEGVARTSHDAGLKDIYDQVAERFEGRPSRLYINNRKGGFEERAGAWGIDDPSSGRGVVCLDYDRDGDIDITVFDHSKGLRFFENRGGSGAGRRFLGIRLVGAPPNTDAIGAKVQVTADVGGGKGRQTLLRLAEANSNFNSQNPPDLHFGLGKARRVDSLRITWPDGSRLTCPGVQTNRFIVLDQRDGTKACPATGP